MGWNNLYRIIADAGIMAEFGSITINGGHITAKSVSGGAGIGSGALAKAAVDILITGGTIDAVGGDMGAGIGGGAGSRLGNITITGGVITAEGAHGAAGIGSGAESNDTGGNITISGGKIYAKEEHSVGGADEWGAGIGNAVASSGCTVTLAYDEDPADFSVLAESYRGTVRLLKDFKDVADGTVYKASDEWRDLEELAGKELVPSPDTWENPGELAFSGHAVLLTGQIGLQFFLELPNGMISVHGQYQFHPDGG